MASPQCGSSCAFWGWSPVKIACCRGHTCMVSPQYERGCASWVWRCPGIVFRTLGSCIRRAYLRGQYYAFLVKLDHGKFCRNFPVDTWKSWAAGVTTWTSFQREFLAFSSVWASLVRLNFLNSYRAAFFWARKIYHSISSLKIWFSCSSLFPPLLHLSQFCLEYDWNRGYSWIWRASPVRKSKDGLPMTLCWVNYSSKAWGSSVGPSWACWG